MSFTDHKISQFVHRVVDLPDQPNLPSNELKARFDSSPEELRVAHNALCDDADRLDDRVSGIIAETFGDTITKSMLSDELADEIDAKATKAEVNTIEVSLNQRCQVFFGTYLGNENDSQFINLGFTPQLVIVGAYDLIGMATPAQPLKVNERNAIQIVENGFNVYYNLAYKVYFNENTTQHYIALA